MPGMTRYMDDMVVLCWTASMRPRLNAGDDPKAGAVTCCRPTSFNEAPAKCRG